MQHLIIDGNNLVHRVFWVAKNQPVFNEYFHIYLFLVSVKNLALQYKPDHIVCAWDEKKDYTVNKRKELLADYKGTRDKERNKEVHSKNEIIKQMLEHLGIKSIFPRDYEADDVMAIYCDIFKDETKAVVTVDRDLCQLIDKKTVVYEPLKKKEFKLSSFFEDHKCNKEDFVKIKALAGDKSDNIPGLKGFGKVKIAKTLSGEYILTEEEQQQYENNIKLVDLTYSINSADEYNYVKDQLSTSPEKSFEEFKTKCKDLSFYKILNDINVWYDTFFLRSRLAELVG